jgi:hypothetical protein
VSLLLVDNLPLEPAPRQDVALGVTFSPRFARSLGLDTRSAYVKVLDQLGVRRVRMPIYWDEVEPSPDGYDFSELDYYLSVARERNIQVLLSLGYKQPRWPECFPPRWAADLPVEQLRARTLRLVQAVVLHSRGYPNIVMWQLENEPLDRFGECGNFEALTPECLADGIALVRSLDERPVLITRSGEWADWITPMSLSGPYFGISLYRKVWVPYLGMWRIPLPSWHYPVKDRLARLILGKQGETIVSELQTEPWFENTSLRDIPPAVQEREFPPVTITENLTYARRTQFGQVYLWGVEWWLWMEEQGYPQYVQTAKQAFADDRE